MAGVTATRRPWFNAWASLSAGLIMTFAMWLMFALVRWDFNPNPSSWGVGERFVLVVWFVVWVVGTWNVDIGEDA